MKRLTVRNKDGSISQPDTTSWAMVFQRLAQYEDTGLEPEDIMGMKKPAEAEKDGEWVVFKDDKGYFRNKCGVCGSPMKRGYKQTNYCPDCGAKLNPLT